MLRGNKKLRIKNAFEKAEHQNLTLPLSERQLT